MITSIHPRYLSYSVRWCRRTVMIRNIIVISSLQTIPLDQLRLANLSLQRSTLPTISNRKLAPALHQHNTLTLLERFIPSQKSKMVLKTGLEPVTY